MPCDQRQNRKYSGRPPNARALGHGRPRAPRNESCPEIHPTRFIHERAATGFIGPRSPTSSRTRRTSIRQLHPTSGARLQNPLSLAGGR